MTPSYQQKRDEAIEKYYDGRGYMTDDFKAGADFAYPLGVEAGRAETCGKTLRKTIQTLERELEQIKQSYAAQGQRYLELSTEFSRIESELSSALAKYEAFKKGSK